MGRSSKLNPRQYKSSQRIAAARRYAAMDAPCAICGGKLGPIHYGEPRDHKHPMSLAIDEIRPVARWMEFGYSSAKECACDQTNWQPAHWICNSRKGDGRRKPKPVHSRDPVAGEF